MHNIMVEDKWDYHSMQDIREVDAPPGTLIDEYNQDTLVFTAVAVAVLIVIALILVAVS